MTYNYSPIINIMLKATRKASRILTRDYGEICHLQTSMKNINSFASISRNKVATSLMNDLCFARPDYSITTDNKIERKTESSYCWVINSIDGFVNFINGLPNFAVSISLTKNTKDGLEFIASVIEAPILGETYFSEKGTGAWLDRYSEASGNNFRLRVSSKNNVDEAVVACIDLSSSNSINQYKNIRIDGTEDLAHY